MRSYEAAVLASRPLAYYALSTAGAAASSTLPDLSGNGNTATLGSAVPVALPSSVGERRSGLKFSNNTNEKITLPSSLSIPASTPVTVEFWRLVRVQDTISVSTSAFTIGNVDNPSRCQAHFPFNDNIVYWDLGNTAGNGRVTFSGYMQRYRGGWTHVCLTGSSSGQAIWLNGIRVASTTATTLPAVTLTGGFIGAFPTSAQDLFSTDHFAVYTRVLGPEEIEQHYQAGVQKNTVLLLQRLLQAGSPAFIAPSVREYLQAVRTSNTW